MRTLGNFAKPLANLCLALLCCASALAEEVITLSTRTGVTQSYLLLHLNYSFPSVIAILFPGGNGAMGLRTVNGQATLSALSGNFLVRTRSMMRDSNVAVAVVDAPSDLQTFGMADAFRLGSVHAGDIAAVVTDMKARFPGARVYLIGTSRGTVSAAATGAALGTAVQGVILTSTVTIADQGSPGLSAFDYSSIRSPVLMVGHATDGCSVTPYSDTLAVSQRFSYPIITVNGGLTPTSGPCDAFAYHGYYGKEAQTVNAMKSWMVGTTVTTTIPATLNPTTLAVSPTRVDFGSQTVGTLAAGNSVTLSNTGNAALSIASIAASGDFVATDTCGYSLPVGGNCAISVTLAASAAGSRTGSITVNSNAAGSPHTVALSATGASSTGQDQFGFAPLALGSPSQRILSAFVKIAAADAGQSGSVFLGAQLGSSLFLNNGQRWALWSGGPLTPYARGTLPSVAAIPILDKFDERGVVGANIYVGYGRTDDDMLANNKLRLIYTVPAQ
jgi:hypothetical protein